MRGTGGLVNDNYPLPPPFPEVRILRQLPTILLEVLIPRELPAHFRAKTVLLVEVRILKALGWMGVAVALSQKRKTELETGTQTIT